MTEEQIFLTALDLPGQDERATYLNSVCGTNQELRRQVEALLTAHFKSGEFLNEPLKDQLGTPPITYVAETLIVTPKPDEPATPPRQQPDETSSDLSFLQPSSRSDSLGRIGHYEVLQVLGRGGFGIVLRAFDDVLQRVVALKVLAPAIAATSPARKRFLREAQASARVRHENVVQIHAVEELPIPYLVMEFIAGETLQQRLDRKGPLEVSAIVSLSRQIAEGLAAAHGTGLIHRDIKPGNILIESGSNDRVKITDFGLARAADDASVTQSGVVAGTPMFMAPEQAQGETLDQRADLFSLGSVMYTMASGRPPFRAATTFAVLKRVVEETPRPIKDVIPETPQWLCDIIDRLQEKKPADRFQTAREVADVLTNCEEQLKQSARISDFSRIPQKKPIANGSQRIKWAAVTAALLLVFAAFWIGPTALLYLSNRGELKLLPAEGLNSVIVLQNDDGDLTKDILRTPMTDWLNMHGKSQQLKLPPGRYQLNVSTTPAGTIVSQWSISATGPFGAEQATIPVINSSAIVTIERGQRLTLLPVIRKPATLPTSVTAAATDENPAPASTPLNSSKATLRQEAWASQLGVPVELTNSLQMNMLLIPPGEYVFGSSAEETEWLITHAPDLKDNEAWLKELVRRESPQRAVVIREAFRLAAHEVTVGQFRAFATDEKYQTAAEKNGGGLAWNSSARKFEQSAENIWSNPQYAGSESHPVVFITAADARAFCAWLSKKEGKTYALPTEEQWEYACRAGTQTRWSFGDEDNLMRTHGWTVPHSQGQHHVVGQKSANPFGLFDMHGNVTELTTTPQDTFVLRGGQANESPYRARSAWRVMVKNNEEASYRNGFRVVMVGDLKPGTASVTENKSPLTTSPFTEADVQRIAALPAAQQIEEVRQALIRLNPKFDGKLAPTTENDTVTELSINTDEVENIAPVRALTKLVYLDLRGTYPYGGKLSDLSPLKGMTLSRLDCSSTKVADLSPLADLPLTILHFNHNPVTDLTPLKKMPLESLGLAETQVLDLSPLKGMKIKVLGAQVLLVTDLSPLEGMPLTGLDLYHTVGVNSLKALEGMPLDSLNLQDVPVSDLSPLKGMTTLRTLVLQANKITDLSPLAGLQLTDLILQDMQITDLSPLKGMPLNRLHMYESGVSDLRPLAGMPLVEIRLNPKNITEGWNVLREMKTLTTIGIDGVQAWPAEQFWQRFEKEAFK